MTFVPVTASLLDSTVLTNHVDFALPFRSAGPIKDPEVLQFLDETGRDRNLSAYAGDESRIKFLGDFPKWLFSSSVHELKNLEMFRFSSFTHGTIQAFDAFYASNSKRRFRCFKGDFMYHTACWRNDYAYAFIEDAPVERGDAIVISLPFSDFGGKHPLMDEVIDACNRLDVPVLVDCAYVNISNGFDFDFDQPCIDVVTFSLSKTFYGLPKLRIGVRLRRKFTEDFIDVFNTAGMVNQFSCAIGSAFIEKFDVDFNITKYRHRQIEVCRQLNVEPSDCVIFGLGGDEWAAYNRGGAYNRICLNTILEGEGGHE
ncbi:hypothetical protein BH10PSE13_BH10PSE13_10160 [soil metagenome]